MIKIIVLGYFSIRIDKEVDSKAIEFVNLLRSMDFIQHVTGPTHNRSHTLDLVITKCLPIGISSIVVTLSDHHCVFFYYLVAYSTG